MSTPVNIFRFISSHPLTRRKRLKAFARLAAWQIKSRFQQEVIVPWIANQKLAVTRGMAGATGKIYVGLHEFPDMMYSAALSKKWRLVLRHWRERWYIFGPGVRCVLSEYFGI
jgi:hypothetical protein